MNRIMCRTNMRRIGLFCLLFCCGISIFWGFRLERALPNGMQDYKGGCFFATGNPAGVAVGLCGTAAWCLMKERFVPAGILCLAPSPAIKPHDTGLLWLYFFLVCGALLLVWAYALGRSNSRLATDWLALAAIVPIAILITYHRPYDAKLFLLTVPACAMLWAEGGAIAGTALLINAAGIVVAGGIP